MASVIGSIFGRLSALYFTEVMLKVIGISTTIKQKYDDLLIIATVWPRIAN